MSKKTRTRLNKVDAEFLGLVVKPNDKGRDNARYRITESQRLSLGLPANPKERRFVETIKKLDNNVIPKSKIF